MLIIARHNEDISWSDGQDRFIVQKGEHMDNWGREQSSFLWYIINHYDELDGMYQFRQGNPFDHWPNVKSELPCTKRGCTFHPGLPWARFNRDSGIDLPETFTFHPGGQFDATAEQLKKYSKDFYQNLYEMIEEEELIAWILERIWGEIIK